MTPSLADRLILVALFLIQFHRSPFFVGGENSLDRKPSILGQDTLLPVAPYKDNNADSCPAFVHGSLRHSLMPPPGPTQTKSDLNIQINSLISSSTLTKNFWTGSLVTVSGTKAARSLRVVVPEGACGASAAKDSASATVLETAKQRQCSVAINAGLFDPSSSRCLGNLVSDDNRLHDSAGIKNAHFGITAQGQVFFGYLTEDELLSGMFHQLVGGAIWLVRNGSSFVEQSIRAECSATQTTGTLNYFASVISARSAVGQLITGELVLVQIVGKTEVSGINLFDLADLLVDLGVYNAINLDGGGSSTLVVNGTVVGSPSDACQSPHRSCLRPVTSVLCVSASGSHSAAASSCASFCSPTGGDCVNNRCRCRPGFTGWGCHAPCRCLNTPPGLSADCHPISGDCRCPPGYLGRLCETACSDGFYGQNCSGVCVCPRGGEPARCHHVNGTCLDGDLGDGPTSANGAYNLVMQMWQKVSSINWMVIVLPSVLVASCLLNFCLIARLCRISRSAGRLRTRWRLQRHEMRRLVAAGNGDSSDSDKETAAH